MECAIVNQSGTVIYTFPTIAFTNNTTADRVFTVSPSATITVTSNITAFRFRLRNLATQGTPSIGQPAALNSNNLSYNLTGSSIRMLLHDGMNTPTALTSGITAVYTLSLPLPSTPFTIAQFTTPNITLEQWFIQPTGATTNNSVQLQFNDNGLSNFRTSIAAVSTTPTLSQVLAAGNSAGTTALNMNSQNITNCATITAATVTPTNITGWNVKELTAGTGVAITPSAGNYTISTTVPTGPTGPTGPAPAINVVSYSAHVAPLLNGYGVSPSSGLITATLNSVSRTLIPFQNILVNTNNLFTRDANNIYLTLPTTGTYRVNFNGISNNTTTVVLVDIILCSGSPPTTAINLTRVSGGGVGFGITTGSQVFSATAGQSVAFAMFQGNLWAERATNIWPSGPDILPQMNIELIGGNGPTGAIGPTGPIGSTGPVGPAGTITSVASSDSSITTTTTSGAVNLSIPAILRPAITFVSYTTWTTDVNQTLSTALDFQNYDYEMIMFISNISPVTWLYFYWNGTGNASHYGDMVYSPLNLTTGSTDSINTAQSASNDTIPYTLYSGSNDISTTNRNIYARYRFRGISATKFMMSVEGRPQLSWFDDTIRSMPQYLVYKMNTTYIASGNNATRWAPASLKVASGGTYPGSIAMTWLRINKIS
jgi:hypothetical protein